MLKYEYIAKEIMNLIEDKDLRQGDKLPSLDELVTQFEVSKNTVIKALDELQSHGLIYQVRGSGIFVRGRRQKGYINMMEIQGFNSMLREFDLTSKVLELKEVIPSGTVQAHLQIDADQPVYYLKRLRYIEGRIFCIEESYFDKNIVMYLNEQIAKDSVFNYLTNNLKLQISFLDHYLRVGKLNQQNAVYLELQEGDPGIQVESIFYLANGVPFDYSKIIYHYEESQFFIQGNSYYNLMN